MLHTHGYPLVVLAAGLLLEASGQELPGRTPWLWQDALAVPDPHDGRLKENENERFAHYLEKTFKKTASLIANSCEVVSVLGCPHPVVHEIAYQYGIAFQLIGDILDFTSCSDQMGKPISADLKLGLATGPVLFVCQQFPEMNAMLTFWQVALPGDVDRV
ncbi:hypothetical protein U0070_014005 [Myodes glareolus]|uniref:Uncharacterized protein n=1 Tax=Myodes glareolus TaxID=447135 RepID=A0AAW0H2R2_MYOGA